MSALARMPRKATPSSRHAQRRVDLLTDVPFWLDSARGDAARIASMVRFLAARVDLRVVAVLPSRRPPRPYGARTATLGKTTFPVFVIENRGAESELLRDVRDALALRPADVALIEYARLSWMLDALAPRTRPILDTHEIAHERNARFGEAGLRAPSSIDRETELALYRRYERVLFIQAEDHTKGLAELGAARALLVPHPAELRAFERPPFAGRIGFVGSAYLANVHGLEWFFKNVWPLIEDLGPRLEVFGTIKHAFRDATLPKGVAFHGAVPSLDQAYADMDIAINPVQVGAGLKIKTMETLGAGVPLVTTAEGCRGLRRDDGAFLVATSAEGFARHLRGLFQSPQKRSRLSLAARALGEAEFAPASCFAPLLDAIDTLTRAA